MKQRRLLLRDTKVHHLISMFTQEIGITKDQELLTTDKKRATTFRIQAKLIRINKASQIRIANTIMIKMTLTTTLRPILNWFRKRLNLERSLIEDWKGFAWVSRWIHLHHFTGWMNDWFHLSLLLNQTILNSFKSFDKY